MISLCITGHSDPAIVAAHTALVAAGMAPARPLARDAQISFSTWHERVYRALARNQAEPDDEADGSDSVDAAPATMGRLWEQLASDLFLANMDAKIWGWANANSLGLLDFRLDLDPSTHFVLLATTPAQYLADQLAQLVRQPGASLQDLPVNSLMDQWQQSHQAMLRFALHHPKRCLLLLADHLPQQADALVYAVKSTWSRKLKALRSEQAADAVPAALADASPGDALLRHFAQELCQSYPQALSLQHEIASVALALQAPAPAPGVPQALLESVLTTVSLAHQVPALQQQLAEIAAGLAAQAQATAQAMEQNESNAHALAQAIAQLEDLTRQKNAISADRDAQVKATSEALQQRDAEAATTAKALAERDALTAARQLDAKAQSALEVQLDQSIREKAQALADAERRQSQLKAAEQEGELLLTQLHQVQEELERYYLTNTQLQADVQSTAAARDAEAKAKSEALKQRDAEKAAKVDALKQRDAETAAKAAALKQCDTLNQDKATLTAARDAEVKAKSEALKQRDAETAAKAAALKQCDALNQDKATLTAARDAEAKAKSEALKQRDAEKADKADAVRKSLAADQENELLLAQLHQVQEELERYYLRNKDLEASATQADQRIKRVMGRQPDGVDWEMVQAELEPVTGGAQLRCRATQVAVLGKAWEAIEFTARIHDGALAFGFTRSPGQATVLARWPRSAATADQVITTVGPDAVDEEGNSLLKEIGTSDWDLLRGLPKLLAQWMQQYKGAWPADAPPLQAWLDAARATLPALQRQPLALRLDTLRLLASPVQAGREYLILCAEQLSLANKRFARLDFRLGCNLGPKGEFGQNARLEFFKGSGPGTFDNWTPNVQDPAGDRLDLVFVFPTSMNLKDWTALSVNDRALVLLLADQLPALLADMQIDDVRPSRGLDDWIALAVTLRGFVRQRLDVSGVQQALPDAVAKDLPQLMPAAPRRARVVDSTGQPAVNRAVKPTSAPKRKQAATPLSAKARGLKS